MSPFQGESGWSFRLLFLIVTVLFFTRCANESVPQGGKQDTDPPQAKETYPENKSIRFKGDKIRITFNEFIKPTGFSQTLISPPTEKRPDFKVSGKTLTVKLKSPLRDSTTYTINFAEDIKDLNEGNTADNFNYVFSTGEYIDSQKISGNVLIAKDGKPADGVIVTLYPEDSVDGIQKSKPFYFAKADKAGNFQINNIKSGRYYIYALKDQNYNYLYDQPNEMIAFSDSVIDLQDSISPKVELSLFDENRGRITFNSAESLAPGMLRISYTGPISSFVLNGNLKSDSDFMYFYDTKDTLMYCYSTYYTKKDTLTLVANDTIFDTLRMEMKFIEKDSLYAKSKFDLVAVNQEVKSVKGDSIKEKATILGLNKSLKIKLPRPVSKIDESKTLQIREDSTQNTVTAQFSVDKKTKQWLTVDFQKKEGIGYTLEIPDSVFGDIFGMWNTKALYPFQTNGKDNYGNLHITLQTDHPERYYIIKLLNASGGVEEEFFFSGNGERKVTLENLPAGSYKFEVVDDANRNGKWDTGNFKMKIQPEKVFTYKDAYQLKGGWDLDVEVKF